MNEEKILPFLELLEMVLDQRKYSNLNQKQNDYDNIIFYLLEGEDLVDPYERRMAGIKDEEWERKKKDFLNHIS